VYEGESGGVSAALADAIRERGPIPFDAFMDVALYAPGGYFERAPIGLDRDFVTSPHVHWWFAYALGLALGQLQRGLGGDGSTRLVELGAGDGALARDLLTVLADAGPIGYVAVERSAGARAALAGLGFDARPSVGDLGPIVRSLVFANELMDNLPFRRLRRRPDGVLVEVRIGMRADRFIEIETEPDDALAGTAALVPAPALQPGEEATVPTGALGLVDELADRMRDSYALLIDYSTELGHEVHGYRRQRVVEDVVEMPGATDITSAVDFDVVEARASKRGLVALGRTTQRAALRALGFAEWAGRERTRASSLGGAEATRAWVGRSRASLLVEPSGLGAHRWSLLATPGLPVPEWLAASRDGPSSD
jgi:SAM-dependent MidA family methyltransferase